MSDKGLFYFLLVAIVVICLTVLAVPKRVSFERELCSSIGGVLLSSSGYRSVACLTRDGIAYVKDL